MCFLQDGAESRGSLELRTYEQFLAQNGKIFESCFSGLSRLGKVININTDKGHSILEKCQVLKEYSLFVDTVRKYEKEEDSIKKAVRECIANGILEDYLKRKGSEVSNMLIAEYDYEEDMRVNREEAREEGREEEAEKYSRLILRLTEDGKNDMIMKIAENPAFREKLYKEYNI